MSHDETVSNPVIDDSDWVSIDNESASLDSDNNCADDEEIKLRVSENKGCNHYSRFCKIISPCCNKIFWCRHCHNEYYEINQTDAHELDRFKISEIICIYCEIKQPVSNNCISCKKKFGVYYCDICKLWDNKGEEKKIFHCEFCGICRVGGKENYFHCKICGSCYPNTLENNHVCIEQSMKRPCSICLEDMFNCISPVCVLGCGHTIHVACLKSLQGYRGLSSLRCPLCMKSLDTDGAVWQRLDAVITQNPMLPEDVREVNIRCHDCSAETITKFHYFGLKCINCGSYNTVTINNIVPPRQNNNTTNTNQNDN